MNLSHENAVPYPSIRIQQPNRRYALEMLDNFGGQNSEMSAISLYLYNHLVTEGDLAAIFRRISIVEMHHLEIFGRLARQLGADPRLWSCVGRIPRYWSPGYNPYCIKTCLLLENAAAHERQAIAKYRKQAQCIQDANIVQILHRIILDEEEHLRQFEQLRATYQ